MYNNLTAQANSQYFITRLLQLQSNISFYPNSVWWYTKSMKLNTLFSVIIYVISLATWTVLYE
jgi:hypothetical protein